MDDVLKKLSKKYSLKSIIEISTFKNSNSIFSSFVKSNLCQLPKFSNYNRGKNIEL